MVWLTTKYTSAFIGLMHRTRIAARLRAATGKKNTPAHGQYLLWLGARAKTLAYPSQCAAIAAASIEWFWMRGLWTT